MSLKSAAIIFAGFASLAAAPAQQVPELGWMSGSWISEDESGWTEEIWSAPRGGHLIGVNRSGKEDTPGGFEYMRITRDADGGMTFWASPNGAAPVGFKMISSGPEEVTFENPANDYPTRIVYRREGETLSGTISGAGGKNQMKWVFKRQPSR